MKKRIAIIWWWAAGMMVAATIIEHNPDADIHIFEKNKELWTKVRISGWGRCNVTTGYFKKQDLQSKYTRWRDFISHAMGQFWPRKMFSRCEDHGVPLKCQEDMRVFPQSNNGNDIVTMFEKILRSWDSTIHFQEGITSIEQCPDSTFIIKSPIQEYHFDFVVITTWWNAYAHTWSSGEWYDLAKSLGHSVTKLWPSLNSFLVEEQRIKECTGISFPHAMLRPVFTNAVEEKSQDNKDIKSTFNRPISSDSIIKNSQAISVVWPMLCTHFWISWPNTFTYSSHIPYIPISSHEKHVVQFVPFADRNEQWWLQRLDEKANLEAKKQLSTILGYEFTKRFVDLFLNEFNIDGATMISNVSREQRKIIAKLLWHWIPITLIARRPWDEFVTAWWVNTDEVNSKTMESKLCTWLFFAGEILNIDAVTWWFNFQSCWATWRCAGVALATKINQ
jgi:predicted flavoprotein YhiN